MNELKIFDNPEFGQVRVVEISGKPYFVAGDIARALGYINIQDANSVGPSSTYKDLNDAYRALNIARGFYEALSGLGILDLQSMVGEDIERIEQKILELKEDKCRNDFRRMKH